MSFHRNTWISIYIYIYVHMFVCICWSIGGWNDGVYTEGKRKMFVWACKYNDKNIYVMIVIQMTLLSFIAYFNHANTESIQLRLWIYARPIGKMILGYTLPEEYWNYFHDNIVFLATLCINVQRCYCFRVTGPSIRPSVCS